MADPTGDGGGVLVKFITAAGAGLTGIVGWLFKMVHSTSSDIQEGKARLNAIDKRIDGIDKGIETAWEDLKTDIREIRQLIERNNERHGKG